jgi:hypothetical protein
MSSLASRFGAWLVRRKLAVVAFFAVLTGLSAALLPSLRFDFRPEAMLQFNDEEEAFAQQFAQTFGSDDALLLLVLRAKSGSMLDPDGLSLLYRATARAESSEAVAGVYSLVRVPRAEAASGAAALLLGKAPPPLIEGLPVYPEDAARVQHAVQRSQLLRGQLISKDGKTALVVLSLRPEFTAPLQLDTPLRALESELREIAGEQYSAHWGGLPYVRTETVRNMKSEQLILWPVVGAIYFVLLLLMFRRLAQALLPLIAVGFATLWAVGLMVVFDQPVNLINNTLPSLILIIGVSNAIYLLVHILDQRRAGHDITGSIAASVRELNVACFLNTLTTALGFASLVVARSYLLRGFGWLTGLGVMFTYVATIALLPALSSFTSLTPAPLRSARGAFGEHLSARAAEVLMRRPWLWLAGAGFLFLGTALAGLRVPVDAKVLDAFEESHPVNQANRLIETELGGILPLEIDLKMAPGQAGKAETLRRLAQLEAKLQAREGVLSTLSLNGLLREAGVSTPDGPSSDAQVAAGLAVLRRIQPQALARQVTQDLSEMRLGVRLPDEGMQKTLAHIRAVEALTAEVFPPESGVQHRITGAAYLSAIGLDAFVGDLFYSLLTATITIVLVLVIFFRSFAAGALSVFPNVLPLSGTLALLPLLGYEINTTTVVVFTISIGMSVDNSIHLIAAFREEATRHTDLREAIRETFRSTGRAVALSNLLLIGGFVVLLLSGFEPIRRVGVLTMTTIAVGLVSVFLIMPAQLALFGRYLLPRESRR